VCTLSFLPDGNGFVAAMNRDELRTRPAALPPAVHQAGECTLVYPQESSGGTWIGGNACGTVLALLNWYSIERGLLGKKSRSRGELIPQLLKECDTERVKRAVASLELGGIFPFRLFGFFPQEKTIQEWQWDTGILTSQFHKWGRGHWFSSSRSDERAAAERGRACELAWPEQREDPSGWLRRLHAGHLPEPGAFSVCVHREDAATVSYTEIEWGSCKLRMRYLAGNPCRAAESQEVSRHLVHSTASQGRFMPAPNETFLIR
jgi:hypothetical protein